MSRPSVAMFVLNPVSHDRRVLREAATLARSGFDVTIYGSTDAADALPRDEAHPDGFRVRRVPVPSRSQLWWSRRSDFQAALQRARRGRWGAARVGAALAASPWWAVKSTMAGGFYALHLATRGHATWFLNSRLHWRRWRRAVLRVVEASDVYHGHDLVGLEVAVAARGRSGGRVVYDSHDLFVEAGRNAARPPIVKRLHSRLERRLFRRADLVITVNDGLAGELLRRYGQKPMAVVHNCVPAWQPPTTPGQGPLRQGLRLGPTVPLVLYHGGFSANRGLDVLVAAMAELGLERVHLALLGYGPMEGDLRHLADSEPNAGRVHVLPAVPPDELDSFVADADVAAMVNQPTSLNEMLSTPNKLFEAIAAGVPIVTSDFPLRRQIVLDDPGGPLGAVCDPTNPASVAAAIRSIIELSPDESAALRKRVRNAANIRWNWEREGDVLVTAYRALMPDGPNGGRRP